MAKQKITISLDPHVLERVRRIAAQRGLSLSAYLAEVLDHASLRDEEYQRAMVSALALLKNPPLRGGKGYTNREELHDRKGLR